jgi:hypothetical protein
MQWRPINDIPGFEEFTNYVLNIAGELRNNKTGKLRKWCPDGGGYLQVELSQRPAENKKIAQHRAICCLFKPNPRNLPEVDHINRNRSDNRIENLQWASRIEQQHNTGTRITNTTGEKNIYPAFNHGNPVWIIHIMFNGKRHFKRFPRDVTSNEIPQEVIDYRDAMKLEIQTELQRLRELVLN